MTDTNTDVLADNARKRQGVTLLQYVHRRNGVPLGASGSLQNMLYRSLGAGSFAEFWRYWNPIWGFVLGRYIYAPLRRLLPTALALTLTFAISGGVHDIVITLVRRSMVFLFTPWFVLMSIGVVLGRIFHIDYSQRSWTTRMIINLTYVLGGLFITRLIF